MKTRIRTIKPEFFRHEDLFKLEKATGLPMRTAFSGLWCCADREGRFEWKPNQLKLDVLPWDECDFAVILEKLREAGLIVRYIVGTKHYGFIPTFLDHQVIPAKEAQSRLPVPPPPPKLLAPPPTTSESKVVTSDSQECSEKYVVEEEQNGTERNGTEEEEEPAPPAIIVVDEVDSVFERLEIGEPFRSNWRKIAPPGDWLRDALLSFDSQKDAPTTYGYRPMITRVDAWLRKRLAEMKDGAKPRPGTRGPDVPETDDFAAEAKRRKAAL